MIQSWNLYICVVFIISCLVTFCAMQWLLKLCKKKHIYDIPNERKVHHNNIPRLGGVLFMPTVIAVGGICLLFMRWNDILMFDQLGKAVVWLFLGIGLLYAVGLYDDLRGLRADYKFIVQIMASTLITFSGLYFRSLYGFCGITDLPIFVGIPLTVFVFLLIVNAFNLIDGIDGLASGLSLIIFLVMLVLFHQLQAYRNAAFCSALLGSVLVFWMFNMFGSAEKGTKIFMGDTGSLTLGFSIAYLSVCYLNSFGEIPFGTNRNILLLIPYTLIIVPCFDLVRVSLNRLANHKPMFRPDKTHLHHKCLAAGFNMTQSLALIIGLQLLFCCANLLMMFNNVSINIVVLADIALFALFNLWLNALKARNETIEK